MGEIAGSGLPGGQPSRRLAVIMFTDLVGYSALAHRDERLAIELLELHRGWVREILPKHDGTEIETVGDAFLIEFAGAVAAVECALAIQQRFTDHNASAPADRRMELRIGIHLGDIQHKDGKVMGDGVNIASRIHGMAEPGGICVSESVYQAALSYGGLEFKSLGRPALKNIESSLELFRLVLGQPRSAARTPAPSTRLAYRRPLLLGAAVAVAAGIAVMLGLQLAKPAAPAGPSVAVLPFENLSAESDSAYFTDGLHDTVIGHLARIKGLKVISRTSVMRYRGRQPSLREIGRELGVAHILEGSVQRAGGRLRVAAQLIDTASDAHVWSNEYDRDLADVFAVQADIAQQVAAAVHARLTPRDEAAIQRVPTTSQEAYDLYLRALVIMRKPDFTPQDLRDAIAWLDRAVALDPEFALAYAVLAIAHDTMYWFGFDPTSGRRDEVGRNVETALRLAPDLAAGHLAKGVHLYHGWRKYAEAMRELEIAREIAPGNGDVHSWLAAIHRRQGRWGDALASYERGVTLDPLNAAQLFEYASTLEMVRRFAEADRIYARVESLGPDRGLTAIARADLRLVETGDLAPLVKALEAIPPGVDPSCLPSLMRWRVNVFRRRFQEAASAALSCADGYITGDARERMPTDFFAARAYHWAGDKMLARQFGERARVRLAQWLEEDADQPVTRLGYAHMLLLLGQREAALAEGERALEQMPVSRDAMVGASVVELAAQLHAAAGQNERALDELERALTLPRGTRAHVARLHPGFDPVRKDPRFERLIAKHLPKGA